MSFAVEYFHSPPSLLVPWCLSLRQQEVRMQAALWLRKALLVFRGPYCRGGAWTRLYAGDFPVLIKLRGGASVFHHWPGLRGIKLAFPYETGRELSFGSWPRMTEMKLRQPSAGVLKSTLDFLGRSQVYKLSSKCEEKGWVTKPRNRPVAGCDPVLSPGYLRSLWLRSCHRIAAISHVDSTDLSAGVGRAPLQFPEGMIHAVKVKPHIL